MSDSMFAPPRDEHAPALDLSIIIPAYNALPYCEELVASITRQDFGDYHIEVLVIDDGSTDGTGEFFDDAASRFDYIHVWHFENSGSPSMPRNRGIELSTAEYIFLADADDYFYDGAIKRMLDHAYETQCDVGIAKIDGSDWNLTWADLFDKSVDNCTVTNSPILNSLGPWKLFRRSLIIDHDIRFKEGIAYEDLPFTLEAYLNAERISIFADANYYKYVQRSDQGSLSQSSTNPSSNFGKLSWRVAGIKYYLSVATKYHSPQECPEIYLRAFRYATRFFHLLIRHDRALYAELREILQAYYCEEVRSHLPFTGLVDADAFLTLEPEGYLAVREWLPRGVLDVERTDNGCEYRLQNGDNEEIIRRAMPHSAAGSLAAPKIRRVHLSQAVAAGDKFHVEGHFFALADVDSEFTGLSLTWMTTAGELLGSSDAAVVWEENWRLYEGVRCIRGDFACDANMNDLDGFLLATEEKVPRVDAYLTIATAEKSYDVRLGKYRIGDVKQGFARAAFLTQQHTLKASITGFDNFSFVVMPSLLEDGAVSANGEPLAEGVMSAQAAKPSALDEAIGKSLSYAIESIAWDNATIVMEGTLSEQLVLSGICSCVPVLTSDRGETYTDAHEYGIDFKRMGVDRWQMRLDAHAVLRAAPSDEKKETYLAWKIAVRDKAVYREFGRKRPAGSMSVYARHIIADGDLLFFPTENAEKNLGFRTQSPSELLEQTFKPRIESLEWEDSTLSVSVRVHYPIAQVDYLSAHLVLADEQGRTLAFDGAEHETDAPRNHVLEGRISSDEILAAEPGLWRFAVVKEAFGESALETFGSRRPRGTREVFESRTFVGEDTCAFPSVLKGGMLSFEVLAIDEALAQPIAPRIEQLDWDGEALRIAGTAMHQLFRCGDYQCRVVLREEKSDATVSCESDCVYDADERVMTWSAVIRPEEDLKEAANGVWCLAVSKTLGARTQLEFFGKKRPVGTLDKFMAYERKGLFMTIAPVDKGKTLGFALKRRFR